MHLFFFFFLNEFLSKLFYDTYETRAQKGGNGSVC